MTEQELIKELREMIDGMDTSIGEVSDAATETQNKVYNFLTGYINNFEISDGRFVVNQDFTGRFAYIQRRIQSIIGDVFTPSIGQYLNTYSTVQDTTVALNRSYNQLEIDVEKLTPARKTLLNQASYYLKDGLAEAYVQPAKYLLMQQVTQGITLKDSQRILKNWNEGNLPAGSQLASGVATPNLQKYATQVSRDSLYGFNGAIQEVIKDEYGLDHFLYVGSLVGDSRPFCQHMVGLKRKISMDEVPKLIEKYPKGLKPNTTKKNFVVNRGGYNCTHIVMMVRKRPGDA